MKIKLDSNDLQIKMTIDESINTYGGDLDYDLLNNKPRINGVVLEGDNSLKALGIVTPSEVTDENLIFS